ncbi:MAG: DNA repair protein RecN [Chloroflexaceae bacterium]|nr:DNA repair protein RecN [Chloroflexaceae bacterium]
MLLELHIRDFAIIDELNLTLEQGFNVLTGETGAGKSIIIDALGLLRGERPDPAMIRAGTARARVEGVFHLRPHSPVRALLEQYGLADGQAGQDEHVVITREISAESGRTVSRINGRAVNSVVLREIGSLLVDIHGQHEGTALFDTRTHLDMLDRFGGLVPLREQFAAQVDQLRTVQQELTQLRHDEARRVDRIEELRLLLDDVQAAQLRPDEEQELLQERLLLQNTVRITELVLSAYALLYEGDEGGRVPVLPLTETMGRVVNDLSELARFDPTATALSEHANEALIYLEELAASVRDYRDRLDTDPHRLDVIEERITLLKSLQRKHGGDLASLIERAAHAEAEIDRLTNSAAYMADLEAREDTLLHELGARGGQLSRQRRTAGETLAQLIERAMTDLAMPRVRFAVQIEHVLDNAGVPLSEGADQPGDRLAFDRTGLDRLEFMISPNPGEPLKPLAKIASGGESARLLLALKSILSKVDSVPTLVFDEVDVGVGGRAGQVVGQKLWSIATQHQVLCITHLPQVAAFADAHYAISKEVVEGQADGQLRTRTNIRLLDLPQRTDELAAMLDGTPVSESSRNNAREILARADSYKQDEQAQALSNPDAAYSVHPMVAHSGSV